VSAAAPRTATAIAMQTMSHRVRNRRTNSLKPNAGPHRLSVLPEPTAMRRRVCWSIQSVIWQQTPNGLDRRRASRAGSGPLAGQTPNRDVGCTGDVGSSSSYLVRWPGPAVHHRCQQNRNVHRVCSYGACVPEGGVYLRSLQTSFTTTTYVPGRQPKGARFASQAGVQRASPLVLPWRLGTGLT
jgi:hypothetical protein